MENFPVTILTAARQLDISKGGSFWQTMCFYRLLALCGFPAFLKSHRCGSQGAGLISGQPNNTVEQQEA